MSDRSAHSDPVQALLGLPNEVIIEVLSHMLGADADNDPEGQVNAESIVTQKTVLWLLDTNETEKQYRAFFERISDSNDTSLGSLIMYDTASILAPRITEPPTLRLNSLDFVRRLVLTGVSSTLTLKDNQRHVKHLQDTLGQLLTKIQADRVNGSDPTIFPHLKKLAWLALSTVDISSEEVEAIKTKLASDTSRLINQVGIIMLQITHEVEGDMCQHQGTLDEPLKPRRLDCSRARVNFHFSDAALRTMRAAITTGSVKTGSQVWFIRNYIDHIEGDEALQTNVRNDLLNHAMTLRPGEQEPTDITYYVPRLSDYPEDYLTVLKREIDEEIVQTRTSESDLNAGAQLDWNLAKNADGQDLTSVGYFDEAPPCNVCHYPKRD